MKKSTATANQSCARTCAEKRLGRKLSLLERTTEVDVSGMRTGVIIRPAARRVNNPDAAGLLAALDRHIVEGYVSED